MNNSKIDNNFHSLGAVEEFIPCYGLLDNRDLKTRLALVSGKSVGQNLRSRLDERVKLFPKLIGCQLFFKNPSELREWNEREQNTCGYTTT